MIASLSPRKTLQIIDPGFSVSTPGETQKSFPHNRVVCHSPAHPPQSINTRGSTTPHRWIPSTPSPSHTTLAVCICQYFPNPRDWEHHLHHNPSTKTTMVAPVRVIPNVSHPPPPNADNVNSYDLQTCTWNRLRSGRRASFVRFNIHTRLHVPATPTQVITKPLRLLCPVRERQVVGNMLPPHPSTKG